MHSYKIVFSDVDGTLVNSQHRITPATCRAVRQLKEKGIPFVIISARSPSGIYPLLDDLGLRCPIISYSGALILDEGGRPLYHRGLSKERARQVISCIESSPLDLSFCIYSLDQWLVKDKSDPRVMEEERIVRAQSSVGTVDQLKDDQVNKILCIGEPQNILAIEEELKSAFPAYSIVRSAPHLLEIMESGISKAAAAQTLCSLWKIPVEEAVAFGDQYNDAEMLKTVGCGILMANAPDPLKREIPRITLDNDHDGIPHALKELGML